MKTKKINIPLSDQVVERPVARELTDKLKGVGIEVESAFYYQRRRNRILNDEIKYSDKSVYTKWQKWVLLEAKRCDSGNAYKQVESIPAYTLPELLEVLPCYIEILGEIFFRAIYGNHLICYESGDTKTRLTNQKGKIDDNTNPATAAAKLLIGCIDNGYIKGGGE